jgi:hypothetical protein
VITEARCVSIDLTCVHHTGGILTELARHLDPEVLKGWDKYKSVMSSTEQGAATQVWAAIGKEWEGKGQSVVHASAGIE